MFIKKSKVRKLLLLALMLLLFIFFCLSSEYFFSTKNIMSILREGTTIGIIALGMTFVIISGGIDLSVGSIIAFTAMIIQNLFIYLHTPVILTVLIACITGALIGLLNGILVVKLKIPDFIATLAAMGFYRGLTLVIAIRENGFIKNAKVPYSDFGYIAGKIGPIHNIIIVFVILAVISHLILRRTKLGTYVYAVGADKRSALLSGINCNKVKVFSYFLSGLLCGIAAIFMSSRTMSAFPELAEGIEMKVIAAVVVGGTSFAGGKGDIASTAIGAIFLAMVQNGIYKFDIPSSYEPIILGTLIVISVVIDAIYGRFHFVGINKEG